MYVTTYTASYFSHQAEQSWVRPGVAIAKMSKEQRDTAILLGKFQAILNKLTPQKLQRLAEQARALDIDTEERLKGCVDLIYTRVRMCLCKPLYTCRR